jgi:hypothetical protein
VPAPTNIMKTGVHGRGGRMNCMGFAAAIGARKNAEVVEIGARNSAVPCDLADGFRRIVEGGVGFTAAQ